MDIRGSKVSFTPAEAYWVQDITMPSRAMPDLAQRLLDANLAFISPWFTPPNDYPTDIATAKKSMLAFFALDSLISKAYEVAFQHTPTDEDDTAQDVISVEMSQEEKARLLAIARDYHSLAQQQLNTPEVAEPKDGPGLADLATFVNSDSTIETDHATTFITEFFSPDSVAKYTSYARATSLRAAAVAPSIIVTLEADLA